MRRRIAIVAVLCAIVRCPCRVWRAPGRAAGLTAAPAAPRAAATPRRHALRPPPGIHRHAGCGPFSANGSQDTHAQAGGATCDGAQLAVDKNLGNQIANGFAAADFPRRPTCCGISWRATGTGVNYPAGSRISRLALASSAFQAVNEQVQAAIARQLKDGDTRVRLTAGQLPTVTFSDTNSDLYWSFRGTQGLTVTGSGRRASGRYVGTLTYVIRDSYGFPVDDTLDGFGPPMRYLQTVCGAPQHAGGAHWFPDTITVTVPFDQPA